MPEDPFSSNILIPPTPYADHYNYHHSDIISKNHVPTTPTTTATRTRQNILDLMNYGLPLPATTITTAAPSVNSNDEGLSISNNNTRFNSLDSSVWSSRSHHNNNNNRGCYVGDHNHELNNVNLSNGRSSACTYSLDRTSTVSRNWEYVNVSLTRVPGYGFGIAVSGGSDNPHFANGDPAIAISDVLKGGPAQGKLQINDRITSANGISLDNVDYATAVQILRDSGPSVQLRVRRRINPSTYKVSLPLPTNPKQRLKKQQLTYESLGFTLSVTLQIKSVDAGASALGLREGDIIDKIEGLRVNEVFSEGVVVKEVKRVLEGGGGNSNGSCSHLNLTVKRSGGINRSNTITSPQQREREREHQQQQQQIIPNHQHQNSIGNLYVQPPTRNPNNNKSFDSTIFPAPPVQPPPPPPRPPLPLEFEEDQSLQQRTNNIRTINFIKQQNQLGIRLSGGNKTGIIVSAVQKNSQADLQGLSVGDRILRVNEFDFEVDRVTREEAIEILSNVGNDTLVNLTVEKNSGSGSGNVDNNNPNQDEFYIRTRCESDGVFKLNEVILVTDTLVNGCVGQWEGYRVSNSNGGEVSGERVVIPNMKNAKELVKKSWKRTTSFRNREFEELLSSGSVHDDSAYEIVERINNSSFHSNRPIVIYSPFNTQIVDRLGALKGASRYLKLVEGVEELGDGGNGSGDGRTRILKELISIKSLQELHNDKSIYPIVVFVNVSSKDVVKETCVVEGLNYSRVKRLWGVLAKVKDKLGSYVDVVVEMGGTANRAGMMGNVEGVAKGLFDCVVLDGGSGSGGNGVAMRPFVFVKRNARSEKKQPQNQQQQTPQQRISSKRPQSAGAAIASTHSNGGATTPRHNHNQNTPVRPSSSSHHHHNHQQQYSSGNRSNGHHQHLPTTPTSSSSTHTRHKSADNLLKQLNFPNFNIPPPCSVLEQQPQQIETTKHVPMEISSKRSTPSSLVQRSTTSVGSNVVTNNFAHSPVFERKDPVGMATTTATTPRSNYNHIGGVVPPPLVDRTKKPTPTQQTQRLYFSNKNNNVATPTSSKPIPPPKPKIIVATSSSKQLRYSSSNNHSNDNSDDDDRDSGQTYLNIPMNSKVFQQQQQKAVVMGNSNQQMINQQQPQQPQSLVTSGYFDWRGGRLVQKNVLNGQIPIEVFIPEGAIPSGETVNVWFQIVDYNVRDQQDATPSSPSQSITKKKKMLSPLVKFGPENYRFLIPVEIRIPQYCSANSNSENSSNMLAKVLMNNQTENSSDYWTKIDIQNGNFPLMNDDTKIVSLTVQQF